MDSSNLSGKVTEATNMHIYSPSLTGKVCDGQGYQEKLACCV